MFTAAQKASNPPSESETLRAQEGSSFVWPLTVLSAVHALVQVARVCLGEGAPRHERLYERLCFCRQAPHNWAGLKEQTETACNCTNRTNQAMSDTREVMEEHRSDRR